MKLFKKLFFNYRGLSTPHLLLKVLIEFFKLNIRDIDTGVVSNKQWEKTFLRFLISQPDRFNLVKEFYDAELDVVTKGKAENDLVMICIVKNDFIRLKKSIEYHRGIGIKKFAILDNSSDDGTLEWLKSQNDIDIYTSSSDYSTIRREAWINRIISFYGYNKWFLVVDSDEMFDYIGREENNINLLIKRLELEGTVRVKSLLLDMYANKDFYDFSESQNDYLEKCIYFDTRSYYFAKSTYLDIAKGGPRSRFFKTDNLLTKYPLFYFEEGDIHCNSHYSYPFKKNINLPFSAVLRHYKFLNNDIKRIEEIVKNRNYHNGSQEYKTYKKVLTEENIEFVDENSEVFTNSKDLKSLLFLKKIEWKKDYV